MTKDELEIEELDGNEFDVPLDELITLLQDAVDSGASVGFLAPLSYDQAASYWLERIYEVPQKKRSILIARRQGKVVGSVQLVMASQQNGAHRAEVQRLIVLRAYQQQGIGSALMRQLEDVARRFGRTLLLLNTRAGDPPEVLYRRLGYQFVGYIPNFAQNPDGSFNTTSIMYRQLDS